jgi:hypothetical protein
MKSVISELWKPDVIVDVRNAQHWLEPQDLAMRYIMATLSTATQDKITNQHSSCYDYDVIKSLFEIIWMLGVISIKLQYLHLEWGLFEWPSISTQNWVPGQPFSYWLMCKEGGQWENSQALRCSCHAQGQ